MRSPGALAELQEKSEQIKLYSENMIQKVQQVIANESDKLIESYKLAKNN